MYELIHYWQKNEQKVIKMKIISDLCEMNKKGKNKYNKLFNKHLAIRVKTD